MPTSIGSSKKQESSRKTSTSALLTMLKPLTVYSSVAQSCPALCDPMDCTRQVSLSITHSQSLLRIMSIESVMSSNHLILCCPLLLPLSVSQSCPALCNPMNRRTPGFPVHHQLPGSLKLMSIESKILSNNLILCCPLLLLPSIFPSIRVFYNVSFSHQVAKVLELQLQNQSFQ